MNKKEVIENFSKLTTIYDKNLGATKEEIEKNV